MENKIRVLKYGGTSVATNEKIKDIANFLKQQKEKLIVVVSAMNKTTDDLIAQISDINTQPNKDDLDLLLSLGEQKTAALMSSALNNIEVKAKALNAHNLNIKTIGEHTKAKIADIDVNKIKQLLQTYKVLVVCGFQGVDQNSGEITTLGRGGSDLSAVALAATLNVNCEIYTDTTGVFSLDPRINNKARKLNYLTYEEMMEMSIKGAGVLEARSIALTKKYHISVYLAKTLSSSKGTWVTSRGEKMENKVISGLGLDQDVLQVIISNSNLSIEMLNFVFEQIAKLNINVDMISQATTHKVVFTCKRSEINEVEELILCLKNKNQQTQVEIVDNLCKVSLIGIGMNQESGVGARVFKVLAMDKINLHLITTSNISISLLINKQHALKCMNQLAQEFNLLEENNV